MPGGGYRRRIPLASWEVIVQYSWQLAWAKLLFQHQMGYGLCASFRLIFSKQGASLTGYWEITEWFIIRSVPHCCVNMLQCPLPPLVSPLVWQWLPSTYPIQLLHFPMYWHNIILCGLCGVMGWPLQIAVMLPSCLGHNSHWFWLITSGIQHPTTALPSTCPILDCRGKHACGG